MIRYLLCFALPLATLFTASCAILLPTIHYRLTVVIDTPQGRKVGSGVMEYTSHFGLAFPGPEAGGFRDMVRGEAISIKLADGKYVFVVRKWGRGYDEAHAMLQSSFSDLLTPVSNNAFGNELRNGTTKQIRELARIRASRRVLPKYYPIVAYFSDISDPTSIKAAIDGRVDKIVPGARLVSMAIEITDDGMTRKLPTILPWLDTIKSGWFDPAALSLEPGPDGEYPSERFLAHDDFSVM